MKYQCLNNNGGKSGEYTKYTGNRLLTEYGGTEHENHGWRNIKKQNEESLKVIVNNYVFTCNWIDWL